MSLFKHNKEQYILSLFSKGDTLAMDKLYAEYADYMASVCTRYLGYTDDVHDVLQEAFIRVFTRIDSFVYKGGERKSFGQNRGTLGAFDPGKDNLNRYVLSLH